MSRIETFVTKNGEEVLNVLHAVLGVPFTVIAVLGALTYLPTETSLVTLGALFATWLVSLAALMFILDADVRRERRNRKIATTV